MNTRVYARTNSRASHAQATPRTPSMRACSILHRLRFPRVHLTCNTTCARGQPRARRTSGGAVSEALGGNSAAEGLIDGPVVGRHGDRRGGEICRTGGGNRCHDTEAAAQAPERGSPRGQAPCAVHCLACRQPGGRRGVLGARTRPTGVLPDVKSSLPKYGGPLEHRAADADAASGCQYSTAVRCRHARPRRRRVARHTHVMPSWVKATMSENICTSNRRTRQPRAAASRRPQSLCAARARLRAVGARRTPSRCRVPAPRWCVDQNSNRAVWLKVYRGPWTKIKNKKRFSSSSCGVGQQY